MKRTHAVAVVFAFFGVCAASAQQTDTVFPHGKLVITAQRTSAPIRSAVSAVTRLDRTQLAVRPVRTLAEALQQAPGLAFVDFEGTGADPQIMTRGFYGGGEADYVLLLLDGQPLNSMETGRINWDLIPLSAVQSIEIVRGPASEVWGDVAIGGVINVLTRRTGAGWNASVTGGEHGWLRAAATGFGSLGGKDASLFGNYSASSGFRDHAERTLGGVSANVALGGTPERGITLSTFHDLRDFDDPGPLLGSELAESRSQSSPFYRYDNASERLHRVGLEARNPFGSGSLQTSLTGEHRTSDRIRTLRLAPGFADTKERDLSSTRVLVSGVYDQNPGSASSGGLLGVDASYTRLDSDYFDFTQGPPPVYSAGGGTRGDLSSHAEGSRAAIAGFVRYSTELLRGLVLSVGTRADALRDSFETDASTEQQTESRVVYSKRGGLNFRYANSARHQGHLYGSWSQSFKAPTPDQLYDRRLIPVPFPPFQITFSSDSLKPQRGTNYEAGIYHDAALSGSVAADLMLSAYQMDLKDEIDFDIASLSYRNIGKSQHRGIDAGLNLRVPYGISTFVNYTLQAVTTRSGDNSGNYLKAIPRHFIVAGASGSTNFGLAATVSLTNARKMFLDDSNQLTLPNWSRWDARASYTRNELQLFADLLNLADAEYSTTGFPDPQGGGEVYYYPAAGRTLHVGVRWGR